MPAETVKMQTGSGAHSYNGNVDHKEEPQKEKSPGDPGFLVLSLDGGGVRGWLQVRLLKDLEDTIDKPIGEVADLIAGTSVGGILAMILLKRDPDNPAKCQYSAKWLNEHFQELACTVFDKKKEWLIWRILKAVLSIFWDIFNPEYSPNGIETIGNKYLGDEFAKNARTHFCIATYELSEKMRTFFITKAAAADGYFKNISMKTLARLTSAAPVYFPPAQFNEQDFDDGGIFCNNPSMVAFETALEVAKGEKIDVLSLGTGISPTSLDLHSKLRRWGLLEVAPAILDLFLNAQTQAVHVQMKRMQGVNFYHRIQPIMKETPSLDAATPETWKQLDAVADAIIKTPTWQKVRELCKKKAASLKTT